MHMQMTMHMHMQMNMHMHMHMQMNTLMRCRVVSTFRRLTVAPTASRLVVGGGARPWVHKRTRARHLGAVALHAEAAGGQEEAAISDFRQEKASCRLKNCANVSRTICTQQMRAGYPNPHPQTSVGAANPSTNTRKSSQTHPQTHTRAGTSQRKCSLDHLHRARAGRWGSAAPPSHRAWRIRGRRLTGWWR